MKLATHLPPASAAIEVLSPQLRVSCSAERGAASDLMTEEKAFQSAVAAVGGCSASSAHTRSEENDLSGWAADAVASLEQERIRIINKQGAIESRCQQRRMLIARLERDQAVSREISRTGTFRWDISGATPDEWSDEVYAIFGLTRDQLDPGLSAALTTIHPDDRDYFLAACDESIRTESVLRVRYRIVRPDGSVRFVVVVAHAEVPGGDIWSGTFLDLTEREVMVEAARSAGDELTRMSRLTTVGELGASIAHELNQPLTAIMAQAGAAVRWLDRPGPDIDRVRAAVCQVAAQAKRAGDVTKSLQALARKSEPTTTQIHFEETVQEVIRLAESQLKLKGITLSSSFDAAGAIVEGDRVQLQQVVLAILVNAVDSFDQASLDKPRIEISTRMSDGMITFDVSDNGPGVSLADQAKLFQPFFTTKQAGLGLGLSVSKAIIEAHNGSISYLRPGERGRFRIALPVCAKRA